VTRQLSQQEIDALFEQPNRDRSQRPKVSPCDFRQMDRIPKSQLRSIRLLHDGFARTLASSLSAYLRAYVSVNLVSVEQLSYVEMTELLPNPTCLVSLGLQPYEGHGVFEVHPSLTFQILEIILGSKAKRSTELKREITEIEQHLLDIFFRIVLRDLKDAWENVTSIDFSVSSLSTDPQLLQISNPGETFVAVGMEVKIGETTGMVNLAYPSLVIKMMRNKFDRQGPASGAMLQEKNQGKILSLIQTATVKLEARIEGVAILMRDLMSLTVGDVLPFQFPVERPIVCLVNGKPKFRGHIVRAGARKAFLVDAVLSPGHDDDSLAQPASGVRIPS